MDTKQSLKYSASKGEVMSSKRISMINGISAEDFFSETIGPMAASILEMLLHKYVENKGEGMTGAEMKLVQFAIERSYGTAKRQVEVTTNSTQEIVAENLAGYDPEILRAIADNNAKRSVQ